MFLRNLTSDTPTARPTTCVEKSDAATFDRQKHDSTPCTFFPAPQPVMISPSCDPHDTTQLPALTQTCRPHKAENHRPKARTSFAAGQARHRRHSERNNTGSTITTLIMSPSFLQKTPDQSGTTFCHLAMKPRPRIRYTSVAATRSWKVHARRFR